MISAYFFKSATHTHENLGMFTLCHNPFIFSMCFVPAGRRIHSFESCTNTLRWTDEEAVYKQHQCPPQLLNANLKAFPLLAIKQRERAVFFK